MKKFFILLIILVEIHAEPKGQERAVIIRCLQCLKQINAQQPTAIELPCNNLIHAKCALDRLGLSDRCLYCAKQHSNLTQLIKKIQQNDQRQKILDQESDDIANDSKELAPLAVATIVITVLGLVGITVLS